MVSSLALGIAAAAFVLFVPLALAGLHLTRNKLLFFGASLFISLAIFIHLSPYLVVPTTPTPLGPTPLSCLSSLHTSIAFDSSSSFSFSRSPCKPQKLTNPRALLLLNGSTIAVAGDSQARLLVLSLLDLLLIDPSPIHDALFRRHSDYHLRIPSHSISLSFLWTPFESNISHSLASLASAPDVIVAGSGLWHMLHVTDPALYAEDLASIRYSISAFENGESYLFWLGLPSLVEEMLNTEQKRARMNKTMQRLYNEELQRSGILRSDGGPFLLLDVGELSRRCGTSCTEDGMHYDKAVYDAAVQIMLNALLIESRQRI